MSYGYLIPRLTSILPGYSFRARFFNATDISKRLRGGNGRVAIGVKVIHNGEIIHQIENDVEFRDGVAIGDTPPPFVWDRSQLELGDNPGFVEEDIRILDGNGAFVSKFNQPSYAQHWAPGRKAIFTNLSQKFVDPRVIKWVGIYGQFLDTCSTVWIDQDRDYGESLLFVNPWSAPIVAKVHAEGGRSIRGIKIPPMSGRRVSMETLLINNETSWQGQVQITANNRVVTTSCKHSLADPNNITDVEHFDPYRADPTHVPAFQMLRLRAGRLLSDRGVVKKRLRT